MVIATARVAENTWPNEVNGTLWPKLNNLKAVAIKGTPAKRCRLLEEPEYNIHTISYDLVGWLVDHYGDDWPYAQVVCDESTRLSAYRGRGGAKAPKALARIMRKTPYWMNLTGTPSPNKLLDLWGQNYFIDGGRALMSSHTAYIDRWFKQDKYGYTKTPFPWALKEIAELVSPHVVRMDAEEQVPVERPRIVKLKFKLSEVQRQQTRTMTMDLAMQLQNTPDNAHYIIAANTGASLSKLRQIANGIIYNDDKKPIVLHENKIQILAELLEELNGNPILIVCHYTCDRDAILTNPRTRNLGLRAFDGTTGMVAEWNDGKIPGMIVHPKSAGHGLNLQHGGHNLVFYSLDFNCEYHDQVIERVGPRRQMMSGYDRVVSIYYIMAEESIDTAMYDVVQHKSSMQSALLRLAGSHML